jgi:amino acid adenylation domain-containing protein
VSAPTPELLALIERLRDAGVTVRADGDRLRYEAPAGTLSADLLDAMRAQKAELVAFVQSAQQSPRITPPIPRAVRTQTMPVSVAQRRLWFLYHLEGGGSTYNVPKAVRVRGPLDVDALTRGFAALVARHEALRTSFTTVDGQPVQTVHPHVHVDIVSRVVTGAHDAERLTSSMRDAAAFAREPFDLATAPLLKAGVFRLGDDDHVLAIVLHHIVADGRSLEVLFEELAGAYRAALNGVEAHLAPLSIQYADYAVLEREWLERPEIQQQIDWWRSRLAGAPAVLELPTDRPRPPVQTFAGGMERFTVAAALAHRLRALAREHGASLYMTMVAAMAAVLSTFTGEEDICIGCPTENRPFAETSRVLGVFINTLVLRIAVDRRQPFAALLERVRAVALDAYERQDVPFDRIVEALQPERNTSASPLFQVALSSLDGRRALPTLHGTTVEPLDIDFGRVKFDFNLEIYDTDDELHIVWFYSTALFDAATTRRWGAHLLKLLEAVVAAPGTPLVDLDVIPDADRNLLDGSNRTQAIYPHQGTCVPLLEAQAQRTPSATAVVCGNREVTYAELHRQADAITARLADEGVGRGDVVALFMDRSIEVVAAIVGVLKSGAAYLPLDIAAPAERLAFMLRDSGARVVLVPTYAAAATLPPTDATVIAVDGLSQEHAATAADRPSPRDLAYVLYTSGSTGAPKAVAMEHRGLLNYAWWAATVYGRGATSFPLFTSLSFDLTVTSIFVPLLTGGRIVVYADEGSTPAVFRVVRDRAVDVVKLTPAHLAMIADLDLRHTGIHTLILGGEDLKTELARRVIDAFDGSVTLYNEYGPTETAVGCMIHRYDPATDTAASVPIGVAADNVRLYVLDRFQRPAPIGAIGEIYVAGDGLARGYLNRPDLTADRFLPDPQVAGARMYRTGDLARRRETGLDYLGRRDRQVKIRGHRIELDEVAAALSAHAAVADCVVELMTRETSQLATSSVTHCTRCGLASSYPGTTFDESGVCDVCVAFERYRHRVEQYFRTPDDFAVLLANVAARRQGDYDCLALVSGGKDSIYMLARMKALGVRVLAYTFDPGYLSDQAKANIAGVTARLGIDHMFGETPYMSEIFADSLKRHANVCNGCFKTLYTLSIAEARRRGIPMVVTGLSRGQLFETRLSKYYNDPCFDPDTLDTAVVEARKLYHRLDDVVARRLDVRVFQDDRLFDQVQVVDFYRYFDVSLREMLSYLDGLGWKRPADTGRSTNCLINDVGIYVHKRRRGYHNYALPYSWDVRMGHKTRDEALAELDDEIDEPRVQRILTEVGFTDPAESARVERQLVAYYVARSAVSDGDLRAHLAERLPAAMVPAAFVPLAALPLTPNGKIDRRALPVPSAAGSLEERGRIAPRTDVEREVASAWSRALGFDGFGVHDNFFALGGHSLMATQVAAHLIAQLGVDLPLAVLFEKPTIAELAAEIEPRQRAAGATLDALLGELDRLTDDEAKEQLGL